MYQVFGQLPEVPSLESYERTLRDIKQRLIDAGANVALVSPPVLGEDWLLPASFCCWQASKHSFSRSSYMKDPGRCMHVPCRGIGSEMFFSLKGHTIGGEQEGSGVRFRRA